jgi:hypothetical protein
MDEKHQILEKTKQATKNVMKKPKDLDKKPEITNNIKFAFKGTSCCTTSTGLYGPYSSHLLSCCSSQTNALSFTAKDKVIQ